MQPVAQSAAAEAPEQQVQQQVAEWLRLDKDAASRAQVQALLDRQAQSELQELMCQRLEFGASKVLRSGVLVSGLQSSVSGWRASGQALTSPPTAVLWVDVLVSGFTELCQWLLG